MHIQIKTGRVELARKWPGFDLDVYGECRDSEQMLCICEPVGMDSLLFQFISVCLVGSLLTKETLGFFKHTAKFIHVPWSDQHTVPSRRF